MTILFDCIRPKGKMTNLPTRGLMTNPPPLPTQGSATSNPCCEIPLGLEDSDTTLLYSPGIDTWIQKDALDQIHNTWKENPAFRVDANPVPRNMEEEISQFSPIWGE